MSWTGCFPELHGFVLLAPERLDRAVGGAATGRDLLTLFSTTELGDRVAAEGVAIPLMNPEAAYYRVLIRHPSTPSPWGRPCRSWPGWVLGTTTGSLVFCGAGALTCWDPDDARHRRAQVPPGWYTVRIDGHLLDGVPDDAAYEFVLTPTDDRPTLRARLDEDLGIPGLDGSGDDPA